MIISAYNHPWVYNLAVIKDAKRWAKHHFISKEQFDQISEAYNTPLYHPNLIIRILLFVATLFTISGVTGFLGLMVADLGQLGISIMCILYGLASFVALEKMFIRKNHYKSGVTEAILYHSIAFTLGGIAGLTDFDNTQLLIISCLLVFGFATIRYLDLLSTLAAIASLAGVVFYNSFEAGGIFKQIIPFTFILTFSVMYFATKRIQKREEAVLWSNVLIGVESASLLLIYISGNYLVVRELSENLMDLTIEAGSDIPFALLFYFLTALMPIAFLFFAIKNKDIVLLRVSLLVFAVSVFTFKYYYSLGHTEITLTLAGAILIATTVLLMRYLKEKRRGFTRENLLSQEWGNMNAEAILISQTMGGNQATGGDQITSGGGNSGGGGANSSF